MEFSCLFLTLVCCITVLASPLEKEPRGELPVVKLPYGSFRAAKYNSANDVYVFKNIPYAAPPVGSLRWAKPAAPLAKQGVQDGGHGPSCPQSIPKGLNFLGPGNNNPIGAAINQFIGGIPLPQFQGTSEDCLYLDIYVPSKAVKNPSAKLPVVVYVFGGGYIMGSKDTYQPNLPFYDGSGMITQSGNNIIFVTFNYRLGAYGFLAGSTMERDGLPNAGLWDQRAVFQWVKDHISLLGGDASKITAMGESAGAGSIVHHLVANGGALDPLFQRAILMSPAFQPRWDRAGACEDTFKTFEKLAGCQGKGLACLRSASLSTLSKANDALMLTQTPGSFAVGPTPDGAFIRQIPSLEYSTGNFWKLESMVLSHCENEAVLFVSGAVGTNSEFDNFLTGIFPNYTRSNGILDRVAGFYPPVTSRKESKYKTQAKRAEDLLRDSSFTCNIRHLNEALGDGRAWNMQYSVSPGWHASDLFATFYNSKFSSGDWTQVLAAFVMLPAGILYAGISWAMQSYLTSYIMTGDPNRNRAVFNLPPAIRWGRPNSDGEKIGGVLNVGNWFYSTVDDGQLPRTACDFWREFASAVTLSGGYSPPGAKIVKQSLVSVKGDVSARYTGGNPG